LGKRSRKQRAPRPAPAPAARKPPSRTEVRNAEARAQLEPLAPGERPKAVTIGAVVTFIAATVNLAFYIAGEKIQGQRPAFAGILFFTGLMYVMSWGLWKARYWAVLGLEGLLGILLVIFSLFALRLSSVTDLLISLGVLIPSGALFWFLVKAMARIQMPERPGTR
jgi:ABC-type multidrug transport system permease subunit